MAQQLTVFLGNQAGRFQEVARTLADSGVNILSFSLADTADYGILRMICDDPAKGVQALRDKGIMARSTEVFVVPIEPHCATLAALLETIGSENDISYMYPYATQGPDAGMVVKVREPETVRKLLLAAGYQIK